jgi:hypothetical protein
MRVISATSTQRKLRVRNRRRVYGSAASSGDDQPADPDPANSQPGPTC